jgi:Na+-driven multidrug efflux pump
LNYILIAEYGVEGAAIASLISYAIVYLIMDLQSLISRELFYLKIESSIVLFIKIKNILRILEKKRN